MPLTRRHFLTQLGRAGGFGALYGAMGALDLLRIPAAAAATPPPLPPQSGEGVSVVILGAGLAGLCAAYELRKAGYRCTLLEAQPRPGGRSLTLRGGDEVVENDGTRQRAEFDPGLYFNAGPARIPHHHTALLNYCRAFGVELQVFVNENRAALYHNDGVFGGRPVSSRQVINDSRGYVAELLAKAINRNALDQELDGEDRQRLLAFLRSFGDLSRDSIYRGTRRDGYVEPPGAGNSSGRANPPLDLRALLRSDFWWYKMHTGEGIEYQATMLQPAGGMDRIARAFAERLGDAIAYNAEVKEIRRSGNGVRIIHRDRASGAATATEADFAVCTIPLPVLHGIDSDLSPAVKAAMAGVAHAKTCKLAFEASRRFWEEDSQIYGGISWTDREITQMWYPSHDFHARKGLIVGAYIWDDEPAEAFGRLPPPARIDVATRSGERLHPGYGREIAKGVSVAWHKMPQALGGWANWTAETRRDAYPILTRPDGPILLAGDHLSYLSGWQEGAILSAFSAVSAIAERVRARRP